MQIQYMKQGTQSQCSGTTQRDGMGRKVVVGFRMGGMHGHSGLVHWDDPEGWDGEGEGRGVQDGEHVHP